MRRLPFKRLLGRFVPRLLLETHGAVRLPLAVIRLVRRVALEPARLPLPLDGLQRLGRRPALAIIVPAVGGAEVDVPLGLHPDVLLPTCRLLHLPLLVVDAVCRVGVERRVRRVRPLVGFAGLTHGRRLRDVVLLVVGEPV